MLLIDDFQILDFFRKLFFHVVAVGLPRTFTVCIITVAYYSNVIYAVYIYKYIYISL